MSSKSNAAPGLSVGARADAHAVFPDVQRFSDVERSGGHPWRLHLRRDIGVVAHLANPQQIQRVYRDIERKRSTTRYLHMAPLLVEPIREIELGSAESG